MSYIYLSRSNLQLHQAAVLLGMDAGELGGALRRRKVRVQHAGRASLHED